MKRTRAIKQYIVLAIIAYFLISCSVANNFLYSEKYFNWIESNKCSPFLGGGLQIKDIDFKVNIPKPWKKTDGEADRLFCFFYNYGEAVFLRTNYYRKYTKGDSVKYYVCDKPTKEYPRGKEMLYDKNYVLQNDTSYIPNEEQLLELLPLFSDNPFWIEKNAKINTQRRCLYYRKGFADILLFNIKPKNFERYYKVIETYQELDKPDGW